MMFGSLITYCFLSLFPNCACVQQNENVLLDGKGGGIIAMNSDRDGNAEIYLMNADGSDRRCLTDYPGHDEFPSWSPDGTKIAYESDRNDREKIFVVNKDGTSHIQLTRTAYNDGSPGWRPVFK